MKSNNVQALITPEIIKHRDDLLMFKYITCESVVNVTHDTKGNFSCPKLIFLFTIIFMIFRRRNKYNE